MTTSNRPIRDFIYLDADRLYSFYSQAFEGIAERIVQSYIDRLASSERETPRLMQAAVVGSEVAEITARSESRVLHDHMYNQLEDRLAPSIRTPTGMTRENYRETLERGFLVKVSGTAEMEDWTRLEQITDKFNELGEAIAYSIAMSEETKAAVASLTEIADGIGDRNQKAQARQKIKQFADVKTLAKQRGLHQEPQLLKNLQLWVKMFRSDIFEIGFKPAGTSDPIYFRAVLDKKFLRVSPPILRALYGSTVLAGWTVVGQITYLPGEGVLADKEMSQQDDAQPNDPDNPSMRDPFRNMFAANRAFERMFSESMSRLELIMCPLAIYREGSVTAVSGSHDAPNTSGEVIAAK
jgi:hypothetical protein